MFKYFFSFFSPQILHRAKSKFSPDLRVSRWLGKNYLYVSGTQQSGPWVDKIWTKALVGLHGYQKILVLGLGVGNLAGIINNIFPAASITGVEIDPDIVKIGKKYFNLDNISNLKIEICDAFNLIKKTKIKYDLIFVDLFIGENSPEEIESGNFLEILSQTVSKDGLIIFNRLTAKNTNFQPKIFLDKLSKFLKIDQELKVDFNSLFFCSRREKL